MSADRSEALIPKRRAEGSPASAAGPHELGLDAVPRIGRGFRLQWEPAQDAHVLLYPEGMVRLNRSAGEILARCDGQRALREIVAELETAFATPGLAPDVLAFVEIAARQRWVQWE